MFFFRTCLVSLVCLFALSGASDSFAQAKKKKSKPVDDKADYFTLRYKPQVGTLYYDVETTIFHNLDNRTRFPIRSVAQLALETKDIDYKTNYWTYEYYFKELKTLLSKFQLPGRSSDSLLIEQRAVGKRTRVTYSMVGEQMAYRMLDTGKLSGEAQFFSYFFQPPRLLAPLPEGKVTYGSVWQERKTDTVRYLDTTSIDQYANGIGVYSVEYEYKFDRLLDSVDGSIAVITTKQRGTFEGTQFSPSGERMSFTAPIEGSDVTHLDLRSGRVIYREANYNIPVKVDAPGRPPASDVLTVNSVVLLNTSTIKSTY